LLKQIESDPRISSSRRDETSIAVGETHGKKGNSLWTLKGSYNLSEDMFDPFRVADVVDQLIPWAAPTAIIVAPLSGERGGNKYGNSTR
jgi:hypothetical protein